MSIFATTTTSASLVLLLYCILYLALPKNKHIKTLTLRKHRQQTVYSSDF